LAIVLSVLLILARRTDNTIAKRRRTDNTIAKRRRRDNREKW
jgi:heme exporter protein D